MSTTVDEFDSYEVSDRVEFQEEPVRDNRSARGAISGVVLGAGLWGVILVLCGVIKL